MISPASPCTSRRVEVYAQPGQALVSRTVRDLLLGSTARLRHRGDQPLKGLPEAWALFSLEEAAVMVWLVIVGIAVGVPLGIYGRWSASSGPLLVGTGDARSGADRDAPDGGGDEAAGQTGPSPKRPTGAARARGSGPEVEPYDATAVTWSRSGQSWPGRTVVARVSHTRPRRVHVPRDAADVPEGDGTY